MPLPLPAFDRAIFEKTIENYEYELAGQECSKLKSVFRAVQLEKHRAKWQVYGYLSLYDGPTFLARIRLFRDPNKVGNFAFEGKYYRGYDQQLFSSLNWKSLPVNIREQPKRTSESEKPLNFSTTVPFSESYNLPQP